MNKFFIFLLLLAASAVFATGCIPPVVSVAQAAPAEPEYKAVLGKSVRDREVADFIASNNCTQSGPYRLCRAAGLAFWTDADQIVRTAQLYVRDSDGFSAYKGELPFGLAAGDTMADVEQKLGYFKVPYGPQAGWEPGLPNESRSPDHRYFWAIYKRFGITVIYNTPAASDKNATIHAILVGR